MRKNSYIHFIILLCLSTWPASLLANMLMLQPRVQVNAPHVTFSPDVQAWLQRHDVINVGIWGPDKPPLGEGMAQGYYQGIAADYLSLLETSLQVNFKLHYFPDSNTAIQAMQRHEIQMVAVWNDKRWPSGHISSSMPWLLDQAVFITPSDVTSADTKHDNAPLGVVPHDINLDMLHKEFANKRFRYIQNYEVAMNDVAFGQLKQLWMNRTTADYLIRYHHLNGVAKHPVASQSDFNLSFGVAGDLPQLLTAINNTLQQIPLISRMRIASEWGLDHGAVFTNNPLGLTAEEESWIQTHQRITMYVDAHRPPLSFLNEKGEPAGLIIALLQKLTQQYGIQFNFQTTNDASALMNLAQPDPDALRADQWITGGAVLPTFTMPLLSSPNVVIMKQSVSRPLSFDTLKGEKLAIKPGNPLIPWLNTWYPTINLRLVDTPDEALTLLRTDQIRGIISPQLMAGHMVSNNNNEALMMAVSVPAAPSTLLLSSVGHQTLPLNIVKKAINNLPPGDMIDLMEAWHTYGDKTTAIISTKSIISSLTWGLLFVIVVACSGIWIRRLHLALKRGQQSQKALTEQLNFNRTLIDSAPVAIYARDKHGRLIQFNRTWSETLNCNGNLLLGKTVEDIDSLAPETQQKMSQHYQQSLTDGQAQRWSGEFTLKGEKRHLDGWTAPWFDGQGEVGGLIGGWLDTSERQSLISRVECAKAELEQAYISKAAFMQTMGHEVRTPLNAIIGLLEMELQTQQTQGQCSENLPIIWEAACNLLSLTGDVFDIFRADNHQLRGTVRTVNITQLIESTVALYRQQAQEKGFAIEIETALKISFFEADSLLIIRILSSLLRNAIKHGSGEEITVAVFQGRAENTHDAIPLVIEVANDGHLPALNNQTGDGESAVWSDTGMSLAACQKMAENSGFDISIESDDESGTTVAFYFSAHPSAELKPVQQHHNARALTILIVDDYPPGRRALHQLLQSWGHNVVLADEGEQAFLYWQQKSATLDAIITDCTMPVMDGFALTRHIRQEEQRRGLPQLPVFGLTAMTGFDATERCLAAGMNECLLKPLSAAALQMVLQRYFTDLSAMPGNAVHEPMVNRGLKAEMREINRQDAENLKQQIFSENWEEAGRLAHRIRGGAYLLQEEPLMKACEALETACEELIDRNEINTLAQEVMNAINKVEERIISELAVVNSDTQQ
ncbi:response regulator [Pantoea trifolii]|uniref:response regulator n=1 Tax=Candidatus Pantoea symbiotica TaxID=1884370 RepID=UPI00077B8D1F|nr:transporter substrate-binding domain-containing protein [Pantoea rodasii]